jgi:hypothetical protein
VSDPFSVEHFCALSALADTALRSGLDRDWSRPAGTLDWSCSETLDHAIDCVFSYALFLGSRRRDSYPPFGELHALESARPIDLIQGLHAVTTMLEGVIRVVAPDTRAVLLRWPTVVTGGPDDFAARGAHEMVLHVHDICSGLGVAFDPPRDLCERLLDHTNGWPGQQTITPSGDGWADLLERSGRAGG